jgi:hypothetical protein
MQMSCHDNTAEIFILYDRLACSSVQILWNREGLVGQFFLIDWLLIQIALETRTLLTYLGVRPPGAEHNEIPRGPGPFFRIGVRMKLFAKVVLSAALLGSLSPMAQAANITIGTLTVATPSNVGTLVSGQTYGLGDTGLVVNTNLANSSTTATKTFFDDFVFTIPTGLALNSISATLDSATFAGISGFSESLYSGGVTSYTTTGTNPLAALSAIGTTTTNSLSLNNLAAGTYTLQFSGTLAKATTVLGLPVPATGTYATFVTVNAVPEPESYAMLLAGLGLLGFMVRRRGTHQA